MRPGPGAGGSARPGAADGTAGAVGADGGEGYRALVAVTTCARLERLRRYLPLLAEFCHRDPRFDLVVALDGDDADYRAFCDEWRVPLVWSERREGVGISKNRVLRHHPDHDYYVFLEDDVELVDGAVFPAHVALARATGIHHFSLFERGTVRETRGHTDIGDVRIVHGLYGGGQFSFFTGEALRRVGGWHPRFAEYRRWGHTEHSWRVWRAGLAPAPFNVAEALSAHLIWHYPPSVSAPDALERDEHQIVAPERELMERGLEHVPLATPAAHHRNDVDFAELGRLAATVAGGERYPLVGPGTRRRCRSDYLLWRARQRGVVAGVLDFARSVAAWPANPMVRHRVKGWLGG